MIGEFREMLATRDHVLQRAEGGHVVALETSAFDAAEYIRKIQVALPRFEVDFFAIAPAIGKPDLVATSKIEGLQKPLDTFGYEMRMVDGKGPAQPWRARSSSRPRCP